MEMQNLLNDLKEALEGDERLVKDGKLFKNKIIELALQVDKDLIKQLLSSQSIKKNFFQGIEGVLIFDKIKFQNFVSNKQFLPDSYTTFKNKIGLTVDNEYLTESKEVVLVWPYKDCVLEGGQTKEGIKRKEIFWNETLAPDEIDRLLAPKVLTNFKLYGQGSNYVVKEISAQDNLVIKGNNLLVLYSLLKVYRGTVMVIVIDPPYNTGNGDFGYNDSFNHSAWLTFMKNRLEAARVLLHKNGSIWINIDDDEGHYLKVLCDEVFGRENFVANIIWQKKFAPQNDAKWFSDNHDHILVYAKNKEIWRPNLLERTEETNARYSNPDQDSRGPWTSGDLTVKTYAADYDYPITTPSGKIINPPKSICWRVSKDKLQELIDDNRIWFGKKGSNVPRLKRFLSEVKEGTTPLTIWLHAEVGHNQEAKQETNKVLGSEVFNTPKPERLLQRIIHIASKPGDIVLDFFGGSGTSAAVSSKMRRRFITCEQMDYVENITVNRLKKVIEGEQGGISEAEGWKGGGSFIYAELATLNESFVQQIQKAKNSKDINAVWLAIQEKGFISYRIDPKVIDENACDFEKLSLEDQKRFLMEVLDKNLLYVNLSEIEDKDYGIPDEDKVLNRRFYSLKV